MFKYFARLALAVLCISGTFFSITATSRTYIYDRWYKVDTLQHSVVGPNTTFSSIKFTAEEGNLVFRTFFLDVDTQNPLLTIESELANDSIIGVETVRSHAEKRTGANHYYIGGTNGDFYTVQAPVGIPIYGCAQGGKLGHQVPNGSPHFVIEDGHIPWCSTLTQAQTIRINGGEVIGLNRINKFRYANEIMLFNDLNGGYTHTEAGGKEIALKLKEGETWKINTPIKLIVVGTASDKGNMKIEKDGAVLSACGTAMSIIDGLKEGDEITLSQELNLKEFGTAPSITSVMGGNPYLLYNGEVVNQGDMARHPRTMLGYTKDQKRAILCLLDGRSTISSGGIYYELADIMKNAGAHWAMNIDGGGSSTMYVQNLGIMNVPSDGKERAVSNGMYLVLNTPEDNEIASIRFKDWSMHFPKYGVYKPTFYGYNKYGMLINNDVEGVELSCSADLGYILNGSTFVGNGDGTHALTATYKGSTTTIPVTVEVSDNVAIRLPNIINDTFRDYEVEVQAMMNEKFMPISATALKWSSEDAAIVNINATTGVLKGVADGTTTIRGTVGDFTGQLNVTVEKPKAHAMAIDPNLDAATWKFSQSGGTGLTAEALENGMKLTYKGSSSRSPYIKAVKELTSYSLPDVIRIRINPGDAPISKITLSFTPGAEGAVINAATTEPILANTMNEINFVLKDILDAKDLANYPIKFNSLAFTMGKSTTGKDYTIEMPGFEMIYDAIPAGVSTTTVADDTFIVAPNPVNAGENITLTLSDSSNAKVEIFDEAGRLQQVSNLTAVANKAVLSTVNLTKGTYIVVLTQATKRQSAKLIVK
ncbi:MAG: phosphodiester glycosidase family protein [Muribaculaceae bacterium]|nr:phosphodiester glycosidase family protein [Muribaculaceae bacterium]